MSLAGKGFMTDTPGTRVRATGRPRPWRPGHAGGDGPWSPCLEKFRAYLMLLARLHWDKRLQGLLEPADLVQQTLLEAHQKLDQFRGRSDRELAGWLRACLAHNLQDALKKVLGPGGDKPREVQLVDALEESSSRLEALLAAEQSSPSERAAKDEQLFRLAEALERLPGPQRTVVVLHHLQGMSLADIARGV